MQLRSDKDYIINEESKKLIEENNGSIIDVDLVLSNFSKLKIISVGDYTTEVLKNSGVTIWIEIVDLRTKRGVRTYAMVPGSIKVENPSGVISGPLIYEIKKAMVLFIMTVSLPIKEKNWEHKVQNSCRN